jgi:hypothetical protein
MFSNDPVHAVAWNPDWASHKVSDLADAAGVDLNTKKLRHSTANQLLTARFDLPNTAARLGHGGGATTLKHQLEGHRRPAPGHAAQAPLRLRPGHRGRSHGRERRPARTARRHHVLCRARARRATPPGARRLARRLAAAGTEITTVVVAKANQAEAGLVPEPNGCRQSSPRWTPLRRLRSPRSTRWPGR